jgi:hypothetical protein
MALAFTEQWSNTNKIEELKQEEMNQGLNEAMVGVAKELVAMLEGQTRATREEMRVHAAARRNAALAWQVEQSLTMSRRVTQEWRRYYRFRRRRPTGTGMGGQSGAVEKATRAHRRCTKILSAVPSS